MSAFVTDDPTIHILVRAGIAYGLIKRETADLVGQALRAENIASVTYRYATDLLAGTTLPGPNALPHPITCGANVGHAWITPASYRYVPRATDEPRLDPAKVLSVIQCFDYQSCEHPGWAESAVNAFMRTLTQRIQRTYTRRTGNSLTAVRCWDPTSISEAWQVTA